MWQGRGGCEGRKQGVNTTRPHAIRHKNPASAAPPGGSSPPPATHLRRSTSTARTLCRRSNGRRSAAQVLVREGV